MPVLSSEDDEFEAVRGDFDAVCCYCLLRFDLVLVILLKKLTFKWRVL